MGQLTAIGQADDIRDDQTLGTGSVMEEARVCGTGTVVEGDEVKGMKAVLVPVREVPGV